MDPTNRASRRRRLDGVVFTTLFALGLVLIVQAADRVDLDPNCVFYGAIELVPFDTIDIAATRSLERRCNLPSLPC